MIKKIMFTVGIFIFLTTSLYLLDKELEVKNASANNVKEAALVTKDEEALISSLELLTERLGEKYKKFAVGADSEKNVTIQVHGSEEYYNSVKEDIKDIAERVIKSTTLKEHNIIVERYDQP